MKDTLTDEDLAKKYLAMMNSAKDRNIDFSLSLNKLKKLMLQKTCYYTGVRFNPADEMFKRSIDRVDNSKGYSDNNVVACTVQVNIRKGSLTIKEIELLYNKTQEFLKTKKK